MSGTVLSTYILYSASAHRYYVGSTEDITNRLHEHNAGETKSIRFGIPWTIVWVKTFATRAEAMALEQRIKSRGIARFLEDNTIALPD